MDFNSFFSGKNPLFRWCGRVMDVVALSLVWLFLSLPVITIGPATAALYFTVVKCLRGGEDGPYLRFWRAFTENLKVGVPATLIAAPAALLCRFGYNTMVLMANADSRLLPVAAAYGLALVVPLGVLCYTFPLLGRFRFRVGGLYATAFKLSIRHLPSTAVVVLLTVEAADFCLSHLWGLWVLPSLTMLLASFFLERVFLQYLPPDSGPQE